MPYEYDSKNLYYSYEIVNNKFEKTTDLYYYGIDKKIGTLDDVLVTKVVKDAETILYVLNADGTYMHLGTALAFDSLGNINVHVGHDGILATNDDWYNDQTVSGRVKFAGKDGLVATEDDITAFLGADELAYEPLTDNVTGELDNTYKKYNLSTGVLENTIISAGTDSTIGTADDILNVIVSLENNKKYYQKDNNYYTSALDQLGAEGASNNILVYVGADEILGTIDDYYNVTTYLELVVNGETLYGYMASFAGNDKYISTPDDLRAVLGSDLNPFKYLTGSSLTKSIYTQQDNLNLVYDNTYKLYDLSSYDNINNTYELSTKLYVGDAINNVSGSNMIRPNASSTKVVVESSSNHEKYIENGSITNVLDTNSTPSYLTRGKDGLLGTADDKIIFVGQDTILGTHDDYYVITINEFNYKAYPSSTRTTGDKIFFTKDDTYVIPTPRIETEENKLPSEILSIDDYAFSGCESLEEFTLYSKDDFSSNETLQNIGEKAFENCKSLKEITIPYSVITYGDYIFLDCIELNKVTFNGNQDRYVTEIAKGMFKGCYKLHDVIFFDILEDDFLTPSVFASTIEEIGDEAFMNTKFEGEVCNGLQLTNLHNFVLPNNLKTIGNNAFKNSDLTEIVIPASITSYGTDVFKDSSLITVTFKGEVTYIKEGIFDGVTTLTNLYFYENDNILERNVLPSSLERVEAYAFRNTNLDVLTLNSTIKEIKDSAFEGIKISEIIIPDQIASTSISASYTKFGTDVFANCKNLTDAYIGYGIKYIPEGIFDGCSSLVRVHFKDATSNNLSVFNPSVPEVTETTFDTTATNGYLPYNVMANSVETIGDRAFAHCTLLGTIGVEGSHIAENSDELVSFQFTNGLKNIDPQAFAYTGLVSIVITKNVTSMGDSVFEACKDLVNVIFLNDNLGSKMFIDCTGLRRINLPFGITSIGAYAFQNCENLEEVTIPTSVQTIAEGAFANCISIEDLTLPFIGESRGSEGKEGLFGWIFGENRYYNIESYESDGISISLDTLDNERYAKVIGLTAAEFDSSIYYIKTSTGYEQATLPFDSTALYYKKAAKYYEQNSIDEFAFDIAIEEVNKYLEDYDQEFVVVTEKTAKDESINNHYLTTLTPYRYQIRTTKFENDYYIITADVNVVVTSGVPVATIEIEGKHYVTPIGYPQEVTDYKPENTVNNITISFNVDNNFKMTTQKYSSTNSVLFNIPETLSEIIITDETYVSYGAFMNCSLTSIKLNDVLDFYDDVNDTYIEEDPITKATKTHAESLVTIDAYAFYNCLGLTIALIPSQIKNIGAHAFDNCINVSTIAIPSGTKSIGDYAFYHCESITSITVPSTVYVDKDNDILGSHIFAYCIRLRSLDLQNDALGVSMFSHCTSLEDIIIPEEVTEIASGTFEYCTSLRYVYIPEAVTTIGEAAFDNCASLSKLVIPFIGGERDKTGTENSLFGWIFGKSSYTGSYQVVQNYTSSQTRTVYIPNTLKEVYVTDETQIGYGAFMNCYNLEKIVVAKAYKPTKSYLTEGTKDAVDALGTVTVINKMFTEIYKHENAPALATYTLGQFINLYDVYVDSNITNIATYAFRNIDGIKNAYLEVTNIANADHGFFDCNSLVYCYFPNATGAQANNMFRQCTALENVIVPDTITEMGRMAYRWCPTITYIQIPAIGKTNSSSNPGGLWASDNWFGNYYEQAFAWLFFVNETYSAQPGGSSWTGVTTSSEKFGGVLYRDNHYSYSSTYSYSYAYYNCPSGFGTGDIRDSGDTSQWFMTPKSYKLVITNDDYIFYGSMLWATGLKELYLPQTFKSIGEVGLYLCTNLSKVGVFDTYSRTYQNLNAGEWRFGNELVSIGHAGLAACQSLKDIVLPNSVTSLGREMLIGSGVQKITTPFVGNTRTATDYEAELGFWFQRYNNYWTENHRYDYTFYQPYYNDSSRWDLDIPSKLTTVIVTDCETISQRCFNGIDTLTTVILPFGKDAKSTNHVGLPEEYDDITWGDLTLKTIGNYAFYDCDNLKSIYIPQTVTTIGFQTFYSCDNLTTAIFFKKSALNVVILSHCSNMFSPVISLFNIAVVKLSHE